MGTARPFKGTSKGTLLCAAVRIKEPKTCRTIERMAVFVNSVRGFIVQAINKLQGREWSEGTRSEDTFLVLGTLDRPFTGK